MYAHAPLTARQDAQAQAAIGRAWDTLTPLESALLLGDFIRETYGETVTAVAVNKIIIDRLTVLAANGLTDL